MADKTATKSFVTLGNAWLRALPDDSGDTAKAIKLFCAELDRRFNEMSTSQSEAQQSQTTATNVTRNYLTTSEASPTGLVGVEGEVQRRETTTFESFVPQTEKNRNFWWRGGPSGQGARTWIRANGGNLEFWVNGKQTAQISSDGNLLVRGSVTSVPGPIFGRRGKYGYPYRQHLGYSEKDNGGRIEFYSIHHAGAHAGEFQLLGWMDGQGDLVACGQNIVPGDTTLLSNITVGLWNDRVGDEDVARFAPRGVERMRWTGTELLVGGTITSGALSGLMSGGIA